MDNWAKDLNKISLTNPIMDIDLTRMTSKGQVVIPQDIRDHMGLKEGERFMVYDTDDSIVLKRMKGLERASGVEEFENAFASMWKTASSRRISPKDVSAEINAHRRQR